MSINRLKCLSDLHLKKCLIFRCKRVPVVEGSHVSVRKVDNSGDKPSPLPTTIAATKMSLLLQLSKPAAAGKHVVSPSNSLLHYSTGGVTTNHAIERTNHLSYMNE